MARPPGLALGAARLLGRVSLSLPALRYYSKMMSGERRERRGEARGVAELTINGLALPKKFVFNDADAAYYVITSLPCAGRPGD